MIRNAPGLLLAMLVLFVFGVTATLSPYHVMRILIIWPSYIYEKIFHNKKQYAEAAKIIRLVKCEPDKFKQHYSKQLLMIRFIGVHTLIMFFITVILVLLAVFV
jgi:hypothetical protein